VSSRVVRASTEPTVNDGVQVVCECCRQSVFTPMGYTGVVVCPYCEHRRYVDEM